MPQQYANVVLLHPTFVHKDRVFTYSIPGDVDVGVGSVVRVPFARSRTTGVVTSLLDQPDVDRTLPLIATLGPGIGEETVSLARWIADRYLCSFGEALAACVPERVAGVEKVSGQRAQAPAAPPDMEWLRGWRGAPALGRSITRGGHAAFSLQPLGDADRAPMIASLAAAAVATGRRALVLVPEVRIRSAVTEILGQHFADACAWLGADRPARDRYRAWLSLRRGDALIGAGGRSSVLAPIERLGLIVVDDESHVSYKERRSPRLHARTVAAERARRAGATLVVVGVPPSFEVSAAVSAGRMVAVAPPRAAQTQRRPPVTIVDLEKEPERLVPAGRSLAAAKNALRRGGRVVILTHQAGDEQARILERAARVLRPKESARLDARATDVALRRAFAHADLIVATPVIAKDVAIERLGLLVICHADAALAQADFRTPEETFSTWWRIARFAQTVIVETAHPRHDAIRALVRFDPAALAQTELARRKETGYPPFGGLAKITTTAALAGAVAERIERDGGLVLGPVIDGAGSKGERAVLAVKASSRKAIETLLAPAAQEWRSDDVDVRIDVDPREVL